jgi:hypothetical protein
MRDEPTRVLAWRTTPRPNDHFELTRPFTPAETGRVLLVTLKTADQGANPPLSLRAITSRFQQSDLISERILATGRSSSRRVTYYALSGYKG